MATASEKGTGGSSRRAQQASDRRPFLARVVALSSLCWRWSSPAMKVSPTGVRLPAPIGRPDHASVYQGHQVSATRFHGLPQAIAHIAFAHRWRSVCFLLPSTAVMAEDRFGKPQEVLPGLGEQPVTGQLGDSRSRVEASRAAFGTCAQSGTRQERTSSGFGVSGGRAIQRIERRGFLKVGGIWNSTASFWRR